MGYIMHIACNYVMCNFTMYASLVDTRKIFIQIVNYIDFTHYILMSTKFFIGFQHQKLASLAPKYQCPTIIVNTIFLVVVKCQ